MARIIPLHEPDAIDDATRRTFVKLLGATMLAASGAACAGPRGEIVPYVTEPPELVPGVPQHYATTMERDGYGTGLIVESREGRPVKVEGNPDHPASLGASGVFEQASLLQLYDPDRARYVTRQGAFTSWMEVAGACSVDALRQRAGANGGGLRLLLEPTASPTALALLDRVRERFPAMKVHFYAPLVSGAPGAIYDFTHADVILVVDADPMGSGPFHLRYARQIADRRRVRGPGGTMSRLYVIEGRYTPTGIASDHRLAVKPGDVPAMLARALAAISGGGGRGAAPHADWMDAVARDLAAHRGRAVVVVGDRQPMAAHAAGAAINRALGAEGSLVTYVEPLIAPGDGSLAELADAMQHGDVGALIVCGVNPVYTAPADVPFADALAKVPLSMYAGLYRDETAEKSEWFVPAAHYLESWGDARALDGTASIVQPLIAPLFGGKSLVDVLAMLAGDGRPSHEIVQATWTPQIGSGAEPWREVLRRGIVPGTASARPASAGAAAVEPGPAGQTAAAKGHAVELLFVPDNTVHDGRFANIAWLQELPDPVSKMTWDNAALMSAATAAAIGAQGGDVITLDSRGRSLEAPVFLEPGIVDGVVVLPFGYGRSGGEAIARGVGVNAYALWTSRGYADAAASAYRGTRAGLQPVHDFALTSPHWELHGRPILLSNDLDRFRQDPHFTAEHKGPVDSLYSATYDTKPQWAMAIDLTVCTGCSACMVACQAENNVPVVGKVGVQMRREMHWLRIDRYLDERNRLDVEPMLCQQCEEAPCEYVCPVNATVHSPDGLNEMVYNRCVGTRFCSNNCPYKVRRFNFYNYTSEMAEVEKMAMNPDVTVRARGVMEKCTFCVQRIRRAEIDARVSGQSADTVSPQTACQQACPTRAIVFGNIADGNAPVTQDARADQSFRVLNDHGTKPRIYYLARLRNPNRDIREENA